MSSAYELRASTLLTNASSYISFLRDAPSNRRKSSIDFHIQKSDYFGTLATVIGLIADELRRDGPVGTRAAKELADIRDELMYLQSTHTISRKT